MNPYNQGQFHNGGSTSQNRNEHEGYFGNYYTNTEVSNPSINRRNFPTNSSISNEGHFAGSTSSDISDNLYFMENSSNQSTSQIHLNNPENIPIIYNQNHQIPTPQEIIDHLALYFGLFPNNPQQSPPPLLADLPSHQSQQQFLQTGHGEIYNRNLQTSLPKYPRNVPEYGEFINATQQPTGNRSVAEKKKAIRWEVKNTFVYPQRALDLPEFERKFGGFIESIDPLFRFRLALRTSSFLEEDGIEKLYSRLRDHELPNPWPFNDENLVINKDDLREIYNRIIEITKLCLHLECLKRGFSYATMRNRKFKISKIWTESLNLVDEMEFLKRITNSIREELEKTRQNLNFDDISHVRELETIFNEILPALYSNDCARLQKHSIIDLLQSIPDRMKLGIEVQEAEIDKMLEDLVKDEKNFGDFPAVANQFTHLFSTRKHIDLILKCSKNMFDMIDIRVKTGAVKAITQILRVLPAEERDNLFAESHNHNLEISKILGCPPSEFNFEVPRDGRSKYFKIFLPVGLNQEPTSAKDILVAALSCYYLICDPADVNSVIFKILSARKENVLEMKSNKIVAQFLYDCDMLIDALLSLPVCLREMLKIGKEFENLPELFSQNQSMYYQVYHSLYSNISEASFVEGLHAFLFGSSTSVISVEAVFRLFIQCVDKGDRQKYAVEALMLLARKDVQQYEWSQEFIEELVILTLAKYSLPVNDDRKEALKFKFIDQILNICSFIFSERNFKFDSEEMSSKWGEISHPWFAIVYLSEYFPILGEMRPAVIFPWQDREPTVQDFAELAKVSTTWPKCCYMKMIEHITCKVVPPEIDRLELFEEMKSYVDKLEISETWKKSLHEAYESLISNFKNNQSEEENHEENELLHLISHENEKKYCYHYPKEIWLAFDEDTRNMIKKVRKLYEIHQTENSSAQ